MNAKKLLSTLLSAAMAVSMLAGCFGGGGNKNYSDKAADAANAAQSTVVFATDAKLSKSLQDALENFTQLDDIKDAMEADENLKSLLTSGWDLDVVAEQGEDAEAAAKAIAEKYILSIVSGKKAEGKIAMVLHDGNGYYYVAVLTYGNGGSGSGGGAGGGSGSGDDDHPGGNPGGGTDPDDPNKPGTGDDDDEEENGPVAQSIEVTKDPEKLNYFLNDYFDPTGMEITLHTNQGDRVLNSTEYTIVKEAFSETGEQKVTIIYYDQETGKELYAYVTVNVSAPEVTSIEVTKAPTKTRYLVDEEYEEYFDPAGMEVKAYFDDGSWRVLAPSEYTVDKGPFSNVGDNEVKITYNDASTSVTVTGVKFVETSVTYSDTPSLGDSFDEDLLTVFAVYDDGIKDVQKEVENFTFTYDSDDINDDSQFTDTYVTVEVSYTDEFGVNRTGSVDIEVAYVAPVAVGLEVSLQDPNKTFYVDGSITKDDLIVYAVYENVFGSESREQIDGYTITKPASGTFDKAGDCEVTVAWNGLIGSTTVTVVEKQHQVWVDVSDSSKFYNYADFDVIYAPFVTDGGSFTFKVQMRPDKADAWKVGGADVQGKASEVKVESLGDDKYQITVLNIKSDITITVKFESVTPKVDSITVAWKSGATIYVGDTIDNDNWSNYLTVTAFDADDNKIENPNITLSDSHTFKEATKYTRYAFTFEVNGASKSATVAFEVKMPTFTLDSNGQTFRQGSSLFYKDSGAESFRTGMRFKRTDKDSNLPITQPMVETIKNIIVLSYTAPNGTVYPIYPSIGFGFTSPGAWKAQVYYYDTSADITYEFTIDITVTT